MKNKLKVLIAQYEQTISLYKHEDQLIWQKLQHVIYINGALATVIGTDIIKNFEWLIAFFGALFALAFLGTVINSRRYLNGRKAAVKLVEEKLEKHGAISPLIEIIPKRKWPPVTDKIIELILWLLLIAWGFFALYWGVLKNHSII